MPRNALKTRQQLARQHRKFMESFVREGMRAQALLLQTINELPLRDRIMLAIGIIIGRGRLNVAQTGSENG